MHQDGAVGGLIESVEEVGTGGREAIGSIFLKGYWAIIPFFLFLCFLAAIGEHLTLPYTAL